MSIQLSEETSAKIMAEISVNAPSKDHDPKELFTIGAAYLIRTVTHYQVGRVTLVDEDNGFVFLKGSSWVADTGRWSNALNTGKFNEVEPQPGTSKVSLGAVVDIHEWHHPLPTKVI